MFKKKPLVFGCFSPPVMIATFVIEIVLMAAAFATRKLNRAGKLIAACLFFLAFFQLCEYFVCGGLGIDAALWSRLGFVAITTLPPLGVHLIHEISGKRSGWLVKLSYLTMAVFILLFGFSENAFTSHQCVSNYVIFQLDTVITYAYTAYYYSILLLGLYLAFKYAQTAKQKARRQALYGLIAGYLVFLLPTAIANTIKPETMAGIPSIMCGFAVVHALILFGYVLPRVSKSR